MASEDDLRKVPENCDGWDEHASMLRDWHQLKHHKENMYYLEEDIDKCMNESINFIADKTKTITNNIIYTHMYMRWLDGDKTVKLAEFINKYEAIEKTLDQLCNQMKDLRDENHQLKAQIFEYEKKAAHSPNGEYPNSSAK